MAAKALRQKEPGRAGVYSSESPSGKIQEALERTPGLSSKEHFFAPPSRLFNVPGGGHASTIFAALLRKRASDLSYERELVPTDDGGQLCIDTVSSKGAALSRARTVFVLIPGLGGNSNDPYVTMFASRAADRGAAVCAVNMRGCGHSPLRTPCFFSARRGSVEDVRSVCEYIRGRTRDDCQLIGIGWSNGGTVLSHVLADACSGCEDGTTPAQHFDCAACLAVPFDLNACAKNLARPFHRIVYDKRITSRLVHEMNQNAHIFKEMPNHVPNGVDITNALSATHLKDLDDKLTRRTFGYDSVEAYYAHSSAGKRLGEIKTPTLFVSALDDPISIKESIPFEDFKTNGNVALVTTRSGGHLGWPDRLPSWESNWVQSTVLDFLEKVSSHESFV